MSSAQESPPSTTLVAGKYQLIGLIGRGGMGSVWEGRHTTLGTRVAIKFIEAEYANSQDARNRFDNEARAAATIQSKHAIQIFDHGVTDDGKPYIVMEMLIGKPLDKKLEEFGGRMTLQHTAKVIQQVSRALARAHEKGIIHRDLKPENIFLVKEDEADDEVAKVLDFGIAKMKANPGEMGVSSSTKTGAVLGTPFYMSPEQARGLRTIDHRTDIWSLGVIVFRCVTGKLPFDGESVGDLLVKICTSPIPVPSHVLPGLPAGFDAWFTRAMEREPDRRFATVQEMSDALAFAAGITFRQPNSGAGAPMSLQGTMPLPPGSPLGGPTQRQSSYPGSQQYPGQAGGMNQSGQPITGPQPALGGTQAPFTTSARESVPMKSNKGILIGTIGFVLLVGVGTVVAVKYIKGGKTAATDPSASPSGLVVNAGFAINPPAESTKLPDPIAAVSVDTSIANAKRTDLKPGAGLAAIQTGGQTGGRPLNGKPAGNPPGNVPGKTGPGPAGPPSAAILAPVPPLHTATTPPVTNPPRGKVDESGF